MANTKKILFTITDNEDGALSKDIDALLEKEINKGVLGDIMGDRMVDKTKNPS